MLARPEAKSSPRVVVFEASGQVAQLVEQRTENPCVGGSIPPLATIPTQLANSCHRGLQKWFVGASPHTDNLTRHRGINAVAPELRNHRVGT